MNAASIGWVAFVICANVGVYVAFGIDGLIALMVGMVIGYAGLAREAGRDATVPK